MTVDCLDDKNWLTWNDWMTWWLDDPLIGHRIECLCRMIMVYLSVLKTERFVNVVVYCEGPDGSCKGLFPITYTGLVVGGWISPSFHSVLTSYHHTTSDRNDDHQVFTQRYTWIKSRKNTSDFFVFYSSNIIRKEFEPPPPKKFVETS